MGRVVPYLLYEDVGAALDWLCVAFGFREELRHVGPDRNVTHAELRYGDDVIMLGDPGGDFEAPHRHGRICQQVLVYVDDVDAHYEQALAAGAAVLEPPADQPYGTRRYRATDPEGHLWDFHEALHAVSAKERGATTRTSGSTS